MTDAPAAVGMGAVVGARRNLCNVRSGSQPVTNPWIIIPTRLETIQYIANPASKLNVKKPNISGIIHSIMVWLPCCRGSAAGIMVIFCWTQVEVNTSTGMITLVGSGSARSSHRKLESRGAAE